MTIDDAAAQAPGLAAMVRGVAVQGIAGVVAGVLAGGILGRIAMRISAIAAGPDAVGRITENGNRVGTISGEGTIALILFGGALLGAMGAVVLVIVRPWLRWAGRWQGVAAGVVLLGITGSAVIEAGNRDFHILDPAWLNVGMFAAIFVVYGWLAVAISDWWMRRRPEGSKPLLLYGAPIGLGVALMVPFLGQFFSREFCGCVDPLVAVGVLLVLLTVAAGVVMAAESLGRAALVRFVVPIGVVLSAGAFVLGGLRLVDEVTAIL